MQGCERTKCCACHEICTSRFTKCYACHEICAWRFTKRCACHKICTSLRLPRGSPSAAPATKSARRGSSAVLATKSANEPHVRKSRFTAPVTKSELLDDHRHVQSAAPATKSALRSEVKPLRSLAPVTTSRLWAPKHEVSIAPATKSDHHVRKCARRHNESAVARSARGRQADFVSLRSRNAHG